MISFYTTLHPTRRFKTRLVPPHVSVWVWTCCAQTNHGVAAAARSLKETEPRQLSGKKGMFPSPDLGPGVCRGSTALWSSCDQKQLLEQDLTIKTSYVENSENTFILHYIIISPLFNLSSGISSMTTSKPSGKDCELVSPLLKLHVWTLFH